jgi:non-canonical (house-cleaning) NTP pyrophosphatase
MERNPARIAIGTTSTQKINYVIDVLHTLHIEAWLCHADVQSGVSDQPLSSEETRLGSMNRAKNVAVTFPNADIGLGIEVGYLRNENKRFEIVCWASIIDQHQEMISNCSQSFLLPRFHQRILEQNLPLGDYVDDYDRQATDPSKAVLADMIKNRKTFIMDSTRDVFIRYFLSNEFL